MNVRKWFRSRSRHEKEDAEADLDAFETKAKVPTEPTVKQTERIQAYVIDIELTSKVLEVKQAILKAVNNTQFVFVNAKTIAFCATPSVAAKILSMSHVTARTTSVSRLNLNRSLLAYPEANRFLPPELGALPNLTQLELSDNSLCNFPFVSSASFSSIKTLNLSQNRLTMLPVDISALHRLSNLDLSNNLLSELPAEFGELTSLRHLNLSDNLLATSRNVSTASGASQSLIDTAEDEQPQQTNSNVLPPSIPVQFAQLTNLTNLNLSNNQLTAFPENMHQLVKLEMLDVSGNQIEEFPAEICANLNRLAELNVSDNRLQSLPDNMSLLTSLTSLNYSINNVGSLTPVLNLPALRDLSADGNTIPMIPEDITSLGSLSQLRLSNNIITSMPEHLFALTSLKTLALDQNLITNVPHDISRLTRLTDFYICNNELAYVSPSIRQLVNLTKVYLVSAEAPVKATTLTEHAINRVLIPPEDTKKAKELIDQELMARAMNEKAIVNLDYFPPTNEASDYAPSTSSSTVTATTELSRALAAAIDMSTLNEEQQAQLSSARIALFQLFSGTFSKLNAADGIRNIVLSLMSANKYKSVARQENSEVPVSDTPAESSSDVEAANEPNSTGEATVDTDNLDISWTELLSVLKTVKTAVDSHSASEATSRQSLTSDNSISFAEYVSMVKQVNELQKFLKMLSAMPQNNNLPLPVFQYQPKATKSVKGKEKAEPNDSEPVVGTSSSSETPASSEDADAEIGDVDNEPQSATPKVPTLFTVTEKIVEQRLMDLVRVTEERENQTNKFIETLEEIKSANLNFTSVKAIADAENYIAQLTAREQELARQLEDVRRELRNAESSLNQRKQTREVPKQIDRIKSKVQSVRDCWSKRKEVLYTALEQTKSEVRAIEHSVLESLDTVTEKLDTLAEKRNAISRPLLENLYQDLIPKLEALSEAERDLDQYGKKIDVYKKAGKMELAADMRKTMEKLEEEIHDLRTNVSLLQQRIQVIHQDFPELIAYSESILAAAVEQAESKEAAASTVSSLLSALTAAADTPIDINELLQQAPQSSDSDESASVCVLCYDGGATHAVVPCGHVCLCDDCGTTQITKLKKCPICRTHLKMVIKIFRT